MPNASISNKFSVANFLDNLELLLNNSQFKRIINLTSGIINHEGENTQSSLENSMFVNWNQSSISRFFNSSTWSSEYNNSQRVEEAINFTARKAGKDETGFLIVDDTLTPQSENNNQIEGLGYYKAPSSADENFWYSHCLVTSHFSIGKVSMPLDFELYQKEDYCRKNDWAFNTGLELGQNLIEQFDNFYDFNQRIYVMADSWYTTEEFVNFSLNKGYDYIGAAPVNYTIETKSDEVKISDFYSSLSEEDLDFVIANDDFYYVYEYQGSIGNIDCAKVLLCWENTFSTDEAPKCILTTDLNLDNSTIIEYYSKRWEIETSYHYFKNELGLVDYKMHSLEAIIRYWQIVYLAYNYLEILKILVPKEENLSYFISLAKEYLTKSLIDYIHEAGKRGIPKEQLYDTLDLDGNSLQLAA